MDVGSLNDDKTAFDIDSVNETNSILVRQDTGTQLKTRWMYNDEDGKLVIHERVVQAPDVIPKGSFLKIADVPGYAQQELNIIADASTVARTCVPVDWSNLDAYHHKTVDHNGVSYQAVLIPVKLL